MKKICFISGVISRSGGTERVGIMIANELVKRGYEVNILSFWNSTKPFFKVDDRIKIDYLLDYKEGKLYRTYIYPIFKLHNYLKKEKIDIVVDIDTLLTNYTAYAIKGTSCKLISWDHFNYSFMLNDKKRIKSKKLAKKYADKLVVLTKDDYNEHIQRMNFKKEKIIQIYNPSPYKVYKGYNFDNKKFIAVGRITRQKGFDMLLKAWEMVEKECDNWKLEIIGDGEEMTVIKNMITEKNLKGIDLTGKVENVEDYYKSSSCYVLSSRYEGFPMVLLEAQSFGLPIISFDCKTGPNEIIKNKENGILVKDGDIKELAKNMIEFTKSYNNANIMSEKSLENIKNYSIEKITDSWCEMIEGL